MPGYEAPAPTWLSASSQPNKITDERVINAFAIIRRELFVPEKLRAIAYSDTDLPLGNGRYLMAPMVAARLLQAAEIVRNDNALVVGCRGWLRGGADRAPRSQRRGARAGRRASSAG
jgi:hypothetical protein